MSAETVVTKTILRPIPELQAAAPLFERTVDAFAWRFSSESSKFALQLVVMVVLARLLPVDSFGLLTLSLIVINFASRAQLGVSSALVQREKITETHVRVAFSLSALSGTVLTILIWSTAPLAAALFHVEAVTRVLRLISISVLFTSCGAIAEALLERKLDYRSLMKVELLSYGIGYCAVGITLALLDYGVWALAWATLAYSILRTGMLFSVSPHSLRPRFGASESAELFNFGAGMTLSRLANFAAANADYFVVGRWLGTTALGLYSRAFQLMSLPMYQFSSVISYVLFPAYARIQNDTYRLRRAYLGSVSLSFLVTLPALTSIAIAAPDLMAGCFGAQWIGATLPLQILCVGGIFQCMYNLGDSLSRARGAVYWKFWCHFVYALCVLLGSYVGSQWGITGVAVGVVVAMSVIYFLMAQLSIYLTGASWKEVFLSQTPGAIVAVSVAGISLPVTVMLRAMQLPHLASLAISLTVSLVVAVITGSLLPRSWLDNVSYGSIEKAKNYYWELSAHVEPFGFVKTYLRQNKTAFRLALIPYRLYENVLYLCHTIREGLWRRIIGLRRRSLAQEKGQATLTWKVTFPGCDDPFELIRWFRDQGVEVKEGGHTFYIPPQGELDKLIPSVVGFYPPGSGFKILKDFRHPQQARYFYKHRRSLVVLGMLIGTPQDQVMTANYLYSLGIGPKIVDLTCWRSPHNCYTVFVVEHVGERFPNPDQYESSISRLKEIHSHSHLRILVPGWERNEDFMPPNCNKNLVVSEARGCALYVDFQNFGLTSFVGWRNEIISTTKGTGRGPDGNSDIPYSPVSSMACPDQNGSGKSWNAVIRTLDNNGVHLGGRMVLDLDCQNGGLIWSSLKAGASWCFGWVEPDSFSYVCSNLLSLGATRFTLFAVDQKRDCQPKQDIPAAVHPHLSEAIIFCRTANKTRDDLASLPTIPWRVLVVQGSQPENLEEIERRLQSLPMGEIQLVAASYAEHDGRASPFSIFLRK